MIVPPMYVYQHAGKDKIVKRLKTGLVSPPGSGKTRMLLEAFKECGVETALIICSGSAVATWKAQIPKWFGDVEVTNVGVGKLKKGQDRINFWSSVAAGEYKGFVIITYAIFRQDFVHIYGKLSRKARQWDALAADEYHKAFRNRKTITFKRFRTLVRAVPIAVPMSGTALGRHPGTLWTLLHLCDPAMFASYWKFVKTFCLTDDSSDMGMRILGPKPSTLPQLRELMDKYLAYIPDEVVADQLPEGKRMAFDVEMTILQGRHYEEMIADMVTIVGEDGPEEDVSIEMASNTLVQQIIVRKLLCCPMLVHKSLGFGGGFEAIVETLEEQPHVIIFVPFRDACDVLADELKRRKFPTEVMYGGLEPDERQARIDRFRFNRGIMVCTIQSAESFDCETCDTSFFLGYIHQLDQLTQAEGRTRRAISAHKFVKWHYVCYRGTVDEAALLGIGESLNNIKRVLERPQEFINNLKGIQV